MSFRSGASWRTIWSVMTHTGSPRVGSEALQSVRRDAQKLCVMTHYVKDTVMTDHLVRRDGRSPKSYWQSGQNCFVQCVMTHSLASWRFSIVRRDGKTNRHDGRIWISFWKLRKIVFAWSAMTHARALWRSSVVRRDATCCASWRNPRISPWIGQTK